MDPEPPVAPPGDAPPPAEAAPSPAEPGPTAEAPAAPSAYSPPPAPAARPARSMRPLLALILVVIIVIVAVIGYAVAGYAYAQGRLSSARTAYNSVIDNENKITDAVTGLNSKLTGANVTSASSADLKADQTTVAQLVSQSQAAQSQIATDDATLAKAESDVTANSWLTVISKSDIDKMTTRIGHIRKALADAKTITADYVQIGTFYQAFLAMATDFDTLGSSTSSSDLTAVAGTIQTLKADVTKAISLDKAPGLPAEMDTFLKAVQVVGNDLANVINAAASGDSAAFDAAVSAANTDTAKLDSFDFTKMGNDIDAFFKPMIDDYNSEVDKANAT